MAWAGAAPSSWPLFPHCPLATTPTLALGQLLTGRSWSQSPYLRDFLNTQPKEAPIANILSCMMLLSFAAFNPVCHYVRASQVALVVKNPSANAGDIKDVGSIPGSGRSPGGGHGNPLQCSCLENPIDRGACWATVHGITKNQTRLKRLSRHARRHVTAVSLGSVCSTRLQPTLGDCGFRLLPRLQGLVRSLTQVP